MNAAEPSLECNFPEELVKDLGRFEEIFLKKQLTAGAPMQPLADDGGRTRSLQEGSVRYFTRHSRMTLPHMKSSPSVNQGRGCDPPVIVGPHPHRCPRRPSTDSFDSGFSGDVIPPSLQTGDMSINTAPTSVTSGPRSTTSHYRNKSSPVHKSHGSWVNLDADEANSDRHCSLTRLTSPSRPRLQRAGTGDKPDLATNFQSTRPVLPDSSAHGIGLPTSAPAGDVAESSIAQHHCCGQGLEHTHATKSSNPSRKHTSTKRKNYSSSSVVGSGVNHTSTKPSKSIPQSGKCLSNTCCATAHVPQRPHEEIVPNVCSNSRQRNDTQIDVSVDRSEEPETMDPRNDSISRPTPGYIPDAEPSSSQTISPLLQVEQWLDSSIDVAFSQTSRHGMDNASSGIPLPPEILDTLRITVSCFPETMLLCSSLSIETIRSHSKSMKFRTAAASLSSESKLSLTPGSSSKSFKWKLFGPKKYLERMSTKHRSTHKEAVPSSPPASTRKSEWLAIKNIFPSGTDYLCDALYAHLLAYNYITSLCPRSALASSPYKSNSNQGNVQAEDDKSSICSLNDSGGSSNVNSSNKIPRKAAHLLGLPSDPSSMTTSDILPSSAHRNPTRVSHRVNFLAGRRCNTAKSFASRPAADNDQQLNNLRIGLAKCIARLVATLRLTCSDTTANNLDDTENGTKKYGGDVKELDSVLIRALCEIVRCCEEHRA